ncbi:GAF and ANTAR domain-containing protein [Nocardioides sp. GCM10027113]|uniref:GAF and ANTAR domain-containing protein n=1 Tax=unclassified Nocardioides TaxID=2615069 RepID=UPI003607F544
MTRPAPGPAAPLLRLLEPATDLSLTVGPPVSPHAVDSTSQRAQHYDGLQVQAREGPCQSAWETDELVVTGNLAADPRWPALTDLARPDALLSVLAVPVEAAGATVGVINAYSCDPDAFAGLDQSLVDVAAFTAGQVLDRMARVEVLEREAVNLRRALETRPVIEQAKGVLVARHGYGPEEAFVALREESQQHNIKLRDLAARVVDEARDA